MKEQLVLTATLSCGQILLSALPLPASSMTGMDYPGTTMAHHSWHLTNNLHFGRRLQLFTFFSLSQAYTTLTETKAPPCSWYFLLTERNVVSLQDQADLV